jgi:signal transduction histidine kinase
VTVALSHEEGKRSGATDRLVLTVSNHVASENTPDPQQLFTRYYRHPNVMGISGMGIGLSLVKSAVTRMGGEVDVHIQDAQVSFSVCLPIYTKRKSDS